MTFKIVSEGFLKWIGILKEKQITFEIYRDGEFTIINTNLVSQLVVISENEKAILKIDSEKLSLEVLK